MSVIPDFIANCGMARVFAYLMKDNIEITDQKIFSDTSERISKSLQKVYNKNNSKTKRVRNVDTITSRILSLIIFV